MCFMLNWYVHLVTASIQVTDEGVNVMLVNEAATIDVYGVSFRTMEPIVNE